MLDFADFLEYATSNLPGAFTIKQIPSNHCYYYQALPGSYDSPHFDNKHGNFSIMAACLSRQSNHLWITVQFKTESQDLLGKTQKLVDLVGNHDFFHEFLLLHLVDVDKAEFQTEFDEEKEQRGFVYDDFDDFLEVVAKPHKHFFNVTMTHASWKKATNILI
jgi:hypothetical protein